MQQSFFFHVLAGPHPHSRGSTRVARSPQRQALFASASRAARGFSLVETLVATTLLIVAVGGLAHLATLAASTNQRARSATVATLLATSKADELLAVPWGDQTALARDDDGSLERNVAGFYDLLNHTGVPAGGDRGDVLSGVAYVRRWSVRALAHDPGNALVLEVVVAGEASGAGGSRILTRILTIRGRRDWWEPVP